MNLNRIKIVAAVVCAFICHLAAYSQEAKWDSTYRPGSFQLKVDQFNAFKNSPNDIVFLGNSITAGTDWAELLGMPNVKNRGISGDITFGVLERLDEVIEGKPAKVFILIGTNDVARNIPDAVILQNYQKIITRIKQGSPSTKIYFQTIMPTNSSFGKFKSHYNRAEQVQGINNALKEMGKKEKITVIDLYPAFLDKEGNMEKSYTYDGLHLNLAGYQKWVEVLIKGNYLK